MLWQTVRACTLAQQGEVAQRRVTVHVLAVRNVSDCAQHVARNTFGIDPEMPISTARNAFRPVEMEQIETRYPIENAPDLSIATR